MAEFGGFLVICGVCSWILTLALISTILGWMNHYDPNDIELAHLEQISDDWNFKPFVDLIVTDQQRCPVTHPDEFLY